MAKGKREGKEEFIWIERIYDREKNFKAEVGNS